MTSRFLSFKAMRKESVRAELVLETVRTELVEVQRFPEAFDRLRPNGELIQPSSKQPLPTGHLAWLLGSLLLGALLWQGNAAAQTQIYRCGNEYTNQPGARVAQCRLIVTSAAPSGQASKDPASTTPAARLNGLATPTAGLKPGEQQREQNARSVLEIELNKAQAQWRQLQQQRQLASASQTAPELNEQIRRLEADMASLKNELARMPAQGPGGVALQQASSANSP